MGWKRIPGKLLLVVSGGCGLVLLVFVGLPWLTEMLGPQEPPAPEEIVAEILNVPALDEAEEGVTPAPSPLVAMRDNGEEIAVLFPAAGGEETQDEMAVADDRPADDELGDVLDSTLPPVLSSEEVAAAMAGLESVAEEDTGGPVAAVQVLPEAVGEGDQGDVEGALPGAILESPAVSDRERAGTVLDEAWQPEIELVTDPDGARHAEAPLPPLSATRDVQELLDALGYAPGPLDGIWGERTAAAWRNFAGDAADRAARTELTEAHFEDNAEPSAAESPALAGDTVETEGSGAGQAGSPHAGLPPKEDAQPVVVPGTLRGVMGYRMPLVSRQGVPDQIVSGVLIPAHTTFVILKPGYWELIGLEPGEVERLRDASARRESAAEVSGRDGKRGKGGWNPLRLFRRKGPSGQPVSPGEVKESRP